jgi:hypothetical protein
MVPTSRVAKITAISRNRLLKPTATIGGRGMLRIANCKDCNHVVFANSLLGFKERALDHLSKSHKIELVDFSSEITIKDLKAYFRITRLDGEEEAYFRLCREDPTFWNIAIRHAFRKLKQRVNSPLSP